MSEERESRATDIVDRFSSWANNGTLFEFEARKLMDELEVSEHLSLSEPEQMYFLLETAKYYQLKTGKVIADFAREFRDGPISRIPILGFIAKLYHSYDQAANARGEEMAQQARNIAEDYDFDPRRRQYLSRIVNMITTEYWEEDTYEPRGTLEERKARFEQIMNLAE